MEIEAVEFRAGVQPGNANAGSWWLHLARKDKIVRLEPEQAAALIRNGAPCRIIVWSDGYDHAAKAYVHEEGYVEAARAPLPPPPAKKEPA